MKDGLKSKEFIVWHGSVATHVELDVDHTSITEASLNFYNFLKMKIKIHALILLE